MIEHGGVATFVGLVTEGIRFLIWLKQSVRQCSNAHRAQPTRQTADAQDMTGGIV